ncbi:MAG TPA: heparan-alpha-glucosaminide N-acetyltransferase domain-containing protein, partial [Planctomycetia bacterium]|nr:heparan-alpha-glucosaminide N-acetyltransferase domain-containing protein [Planctomycetia bacterium]
MNEPLPFASSRTSRLASLDVLRGLVILLMAVDHVRAFWGGNLGEPVNLSDPKNNLTFGLVRWSTHFCAPTFVLLAGMGGWLWGRSKTPAARAWHLFDRGLWLLLLELTLVKTGWSLQIDFSFFVIQVIGAIGLSMMMLAPLALAPSWAALAVGVAVMALHNLADGPPKPGPGLGPTFWRLLHEQGTLIAYQNPDSRPNVFIAYPILPWFGIMCFGYGLAPVITLCEGARRRLLLLLGFGLSTLFLLFRMAGLPGDSNQFVAHSGEPVRTLLQFLNCTKYPPSLHFA